MYKKFSLSHLSLLAITLRRNIVGTEETVRSNRFIYHFCPRWIEAMLPYLVSLLYKLQLLDLLP
jgi:hypothetical protein